MTAAERGQLLSRTLVRTTTHYGGQIETYKIVRAGLGRPRRYTQLVAKFRDDQGDTHTKAYSTREVARGIGNPDRIVIPVIELGIYRVGLIAAMNYLRIKNERS